MSCAALSCAALFMLAAIGDAATARPAPTASSEQSTGRWAEDVTRDFYNASQRLAWSRQGGDWIDADGKPHGGKPFAELSFPAVGKKVETRMDIDVTDLVRRHGGEIWLTGSAVTLYARESGKGAVLKVTRRGATTDLPVVADGALSPSTFRDAAKRPTLGLTGAALLRFNQAADPTIKRALLRLTVEKTTSMTPAVRVFVPRPQVSYPRSPVAANGTEADVLMRLKGPAWKRGTRYTPTGVLNRNGSLTVAVPAGGATGSNNLYIIPKDKRRPTMFARIVMTLHDDFDPEMGGKLPGLANTGQGDRRERKAAWGSRTADGTSWSARTNRFPVASGARRMGFSSYAYRHNRKGYYGEGEPSAESLPIGKAFVLDQMVKLNTIAADGKPNADGEIAYWLNGVCVNRMTGIVWRTNAGPDTLPSEYWLDVYVGGQGYKAPHPHHVTFHEATLSTKLLPFDKAVLDRLNRGA